LIERVA
jgi:hypothetical protein